MTRSATEHIDDIESFIKFCSWNVKSILLEYALNHIIKNIGFKPKTLVDIGSGKGNDLNRWINIGINEVIGLECSDEQIKEAIHRLIATRKIKKVKMPLVRYIKGSAVNANDYKKIKELAPKVYLITANFCINYFFKNKEESNTMLSNVADLLLPGGLFIGTALDADALNDSINSNMVHYKPNEQGPGYYFRLNNTQYFKEEAYLEYYLSKDQLINACSKFGLVPVTLSKDFWALSNFNDFPTLTDHNSMPYKRVKELEKLYFAFSFIKVP